MSRPQPATSAARIVEFNVFSGSSRPFGDVLVGVAAGFVESISPRVHNGEHNMANTFDICVTFTPREEGGYVDDPSDPGGATNMGVTLATYRQWSDDPISVTCRSRT